MRVEIEALLTELVIECGETFAVALRCEDDVWSATVYATAAPKMPLFDRRGEAQLVGRGESVAAALDALNERCAIPHAA